MTFISRMSEQGSRDSLTGIYTADLKATPPGSWAAEHEQVSKEHSTLCIRSSLELMDKSHLHAKCPLTDEANTNKK